ncbi:MAG: hypothetical protein Q8K58_03940 [Acidimicrobiales bacterium]|nr:hypothetical protein [Acidimicrobiales bacterium]
MTVALAERREQRRTLAPSAGDERLDGAVVALCALIRCIELPLSFLPLTWTKDQWDWPLDPVAEVPDDSLRRNASQLIGEMHDLRRHLGDALTCALPELDARTIGAIRALSFFIHTAVLVAPTRYCVQLIEMDALPTGFHPATFTLN